MNTNIKNIATLKSLAIDKELRKSLRNDVRKFSHDLGYDIPDNLDVVVVNNTKDKFYFVIPDKSISYEDVKSITAAEVGVGTTGTVGTGGSISTLGSAGGTVGTLGTIGSVGTAGTAGA